MEIELPDGTVLDAPDGSDTRKVVRGYHIAQLKIKNPAEYNPDSKEYSDKYGPVSQGQTGLREGIGSGMERMSRGIGSVANNVFNKHPLVKLFGGIDLPGKEIYNDEAIKDQDQLDSPLARTTRGTIGQGIGQTAVAAAVTAPIGGLGGLSTSGSILARTLARPTLRAALEGSVAGAGAANPDEQGSGALKGATVGAIIERFLAGGGRLLRGAAKKSEAVKDLEHEMGKSLDIPISQSLSDDDMLSRGVRAMYEEGLPNILGVKGQLSRQSRSAAKEVAESGNDLAREIGESEVFNQPVTRGSRTSKLLTTVGLGGLAAANPLASLTILLGGNAMATKTVQRAFTGDTVAQKTLVKIIAKHPEVADELKRFVQSGGAAEAGDGGP